MRIKARIFAGMSFLLFINIEVRDQVRDKVRDQARDQAQERDLRTRIKTFSTLHSAKSSKHQLILTAFPYYLEISSQVFLYFEVCSKAKNVISAH